MASVGLQSCGQRGPSRVQEETRTGNRATLHLVTASGAPCQEQCHLPTIPRGRSSPAARDQSKSRGRERGECRGIPNSGGLLEGLRARTLEASGTGCHAKIV